MLLEKARELIDTQVSIGGGYNRNAVRLILAEIARDHDQSVVDGLIREFDLESAFGIRPGTDFSNMFNK